MSSDTAAYIPRRAVLRFALLLAGALALSVASGRLYDGFVRDYPAYLAPPSSEPGDLGQMLHAWREFQEAGPAEDTYHHMFFEEQNGYLYPPCALLPLYVLPDVGTDGFVRGSRVLTRLAALGAAFAAMLCFRRSWSLLSRQGPWSGSGRTLSIEDAIVWFAALMYYPLARAMHLNQLQSLITVLQSGMLLALLYSHSRLSGVLAGVAACVKPHFGLVALWGVCRRRWGFVGTLIAVVVTINLIGLCTFGVQNTRTYWAQVVPYLARIGEPTSFNQSMNGLCHALTLHAEIDDPDAPYPPYDRRVHAATIAAAVVLMGLAVLLAIRSFDGPLADAIGLGAMVLAVTMSSSVAWDHHYSCLVPALAIAYPAIRLCRGRSVGTGSLFWVTYALTGFYWEARYLHPGWTAAGRFTMYLGGWLAMAVFWRVSTCLRDRRRVS